MILLDDSGIEVDDVVRLVVPLLALVMFAVSILAYRRTKTSRVLLIAAAFGVYFVKSLFISSEVFYPEESDRLDFLSITCDVVILSLFAAGFLKR